MPLTESQPDALSSIYARSLYDLAEQAGGRESVEGALGDLHDVMEFSRADARFSEFLASRVLPVDRRAASLRAIFNGRLSDLVVRFLQVLNEKGRLSHLPSIVASLDRMVQEKFGRVEVDLYTAVPVEPRELAGIKSLLQKALGREPIVHSYTEESMLGGVKLQVGDRLIDGSLLTQLRRMRDKLTRDGAAALRARGDRVMAGIDQPVASAEITPKPAPRGVPAPARTTGPAEPMAAGTERGGDRHTGKKTVAAVEVGGQRVLIRVDFNVPVEAGVITDDRRIREAVPTIRSVIERGGRAILISHLGRPEGTGFEAAYSLKICADHLSQLLGRPVAFPSKDCTDADAAAAVAAARDGEVVLLENLRFHKAEKKGEPQFAAKLAAYGDAYVNDAFGTCHRADASMVALPKAMAGRPRVIGFLIEKEIAYLSAALRDPRRPFVVVLGGAKVSDKMGAIEHLLPKADAVLVGGAMAYTFLAALGKGVGNSRVEADRMADAKRTLDLAARLKAKLYLPKDHVCSTIFAESGGQIAVYAEQIPDGFMGLDIGPVTQAQYAAVLEKAGTIVWNGPMGVFEWPAFRVGTQQVARAAAEATQRGGVSIVGGGDSAAAVDAFGLAGQLSHVSTGGGASLEMLEGKTFESVELLDNE
ncbi:MAG: ATP synthase F1 subunit delta [Phycisphaerales bacterium]|nr:ATP synthase F1 subunit delta [Phycisphaerales bacterium]